MAVDLRRFLCWIYRSKIGQLRKFPKAADNIAQKMSIKEATKSGILKKNSISRLLQFFEPNLKNYLQALPLLFSV
jgi:hypothetical protein